MNWLLIVGIVLIVVSILVGVFSTSLTYHKRDIVQILANFGFDAGLCCAAGYLLVQFFVLSQS